MAHSIRPEEGEALPTDFASAEELQSSRGFVGHIENFLAILMTCAVIALALDLYRTVGLLPYPEQFLAAILAVAMPLVYIRYGVNRELRRGSVPWYDLLAAVVTCAGWIYVVVRLPVLSTRVAMTPTDGLIVAAILGLLLLEGLRRTSGWALVLTVLGFFFLAVSRRPSADGSRWPADPHRHAHLLFDLGCNGDAGADARHRGRHRHRLRAVR